MTPNMFLHLLYLQAYEYVIAFDKNEKQLGSGKSFVNVKDQILFHIILEYAGKFERKGFSNILAELLQVVLFYKPEYAQQYHDPIAELKQIMIAEILEKFSLGTYDPAMCGLAAHLDMQLREHLEILSTFSIDAIRIAASREAKDYTCSTQKILKSLGVVSLAYATLVFDITLFQKDKGKWFYYSYCPFEKTLGEEVGWADEMLSIVFESGKHHLVHAEMPFNDIVTGKIDSNDVFNWFKKNSGLHTHIFILYSHFDMYRALMLNYETQKEDTPNNQARKISRLIWLLKCLNALRDARLTSGGTIFQTRGILSYELYDRVKESDQQFFIWHKKAIATEKFGFDVDGDIRKIIYAYRCHSNIYYFHVFQ